MIANAALMLLARPDQLAVARSDRAMLDAAIEESLRLEPAAAVIDRYATRAVTLGGARIGAGELVRLSLAAANRDPAVFADPDEFDLTRSDRRHLAFAQGPHVCVGVHLARLEARTALRTLLARLDDLRADPERPAEIRGLVFRKPPRLDAIWTVPGRSLVLGLELPTARRANVKLSARNKLAGSVTEINRGEAIANVAIDVSGQRLVASITVEAVEELGLTEGSKVTAIVKASDVILAAD